MVNIWIEGDHERFDKSRMMMLAHHDANGLIFNSVMMETEKFNEQVGKGNMYLGMTNW